MTEENSRALSLPKAHDPTNREKATVTVKRTQRRVSTLPDVQLVDTIHLHATLRVISNRI